MKTIVGGIAAIALLIAGAQAATVSATITINGSGTSSSGNYTLSGSAAFTGGLTGSGTLSSTFSITTPSVLAGTVPVTVTVSSGGTTGTLTGTLTGSSTILLQVISGSPTATGPATIAFTSGTGGFAGATGTFNVTATGTGFGTSGSGAGTFTVTGPGTLNLGGTVGPPSPTITHVWDGASNTDNVVPGAIFIVKGTTLTPFNGVNSFSIPRPTVAPDGVKITFTPVGGGASIDAYLVYEYSDSTRQQLSGILPSSAAPGNYNVVVTNGTASAPVTVTVVKSKITLFTFDSRGGGLAILQNFVSATQYDLNRFTTYSSGGYTFSPAHPGQTEIAWATGIGSLAGGDNSVAGAYYDFSAHGSNVKAIVGGMTIGVGYAGPAGYPGEDQINFTLPANVPTGCTVPFQISVDGVLSNATFMAIAPQGAAACVQPGFTTAQLTSYDNGATTTVGSFELSQFQETVPSFGTVKINSASGQFQTYSGFELAGLAQATLSNVGACTVAHTTQTGTTTVAAANGIGLDAGTVTLNGPAASSISNKAFTEVVDPDSTSYGAYSLTLATDGLPAGGGTGSIVAGQYTLAGNGGKDVGKFNASLTIGTPLNITGGLPSTITRSAGLPLSWTGGGANDPVQIIGSSSTTTGTGTTAVTDNYTFICTTTAGTGGFTVPASVLTQLPASQVTSSGSGGFLEVGSSVVPASFTAPLVAGGSINNGYFLAFLGSGALVTYN